MYGLIIRSICDFILAEHGISTLNDILRRIDRPDGFHIHQEYPENTVADLAEAAFKVTGVPRDQLMTSFGEYFISNAHRLHLDPIHLLPVLGRSLKDFFNGLDNLHEYMRSVYPQMSAPSFFCEEETRQGMTLHYRSRRRGYVHYVIGQIRHVARNLYNQDVEIEILRETELPSVPTLSSLLDVALLVRFDNVGYKLEENAKMVTGHHFNGYNSVTPDNHDAPKFVIGECPMTCPMMTSQSRCPEFKTMNGCERRPCDKIRESVSSVSDCDFEMKTSLFEEKNSDCLSSSSPMKISSETFFEGFPFYILFDKGMTIQHVGRALGNVLPDLVGQSVNEVFSLVKPLVEFTVENILKYANNIFEMRSVEGISRRGDKIADADVNSMIYPALKGQMIFISEWNAIVYLCTPMLKSVEQLTEWGLFLHDLSIHDSSRDMLIASKQYDADLKQAAEQEEIQAAQLIKSEKKLKKLISKTDCLLHKMMPKSVADRMRMGDDAANTLQSFDCVSILFSDIVDFTKICSAISPMAVIEMLNSVYTAFDNISRRHSVYKVETIGDAYMVVSGVPDVTPCHAEHICNMALDMMSSIMTLQHPTTGQDMRIRIGVHSGPIVAGVVALKMKRYCLFGKTVNIATKMESSGKPMKIHVSEKTKFYLERSAEFEYVLEKTTHQVDIRDKDGTSLKTFWVIERNNRLKTLQQTS